MLIFQDVQWLFKIAKIPRWFSKMYNNYPRFSKIPRYWFSKMYQNYSRFLRFQDWFSKMYCNYSRFLRFRDIDFPKFTKIPRSSKRIQDLLKFQDIDPMSNISGFFWHPYFPTFQFQLFEFCYFQNFDICKNNISKKGFVSDFLRYPGVSKDKNKWFWEERTRLKIQKS